MVFIHLRIIFVYSLFFATYVHSNSVAQDSSPSEEKFEKALQTTGDIVQFALPSAGLITSVVIKDWEGTKQLGYSFATNLVLTHSLKYLISKKRPETSGAYNAFPSGHTSASFQGASFIQKRYGWKYGIPAYLLAAFVGYSRIEGFNDRHDVWDVLGGAIVGTGSTYLFAKPYKKKDINLTLYSNGENNFRLVFHYQF